MRLKAKVGVNCDLKQICLYSVYYIRQLLVFAPFYFRSFRPFCQLADLDTANSNVSYYLFLTATLLERIQDNTNPEVEAKISRVENTSVSSISTSGKARKLKLNWNNDSKTFQDYIRHVEQQFVLRSSKWHIALASTQNAVKRSY